LDLDFALSSFDLRPWTLDFALWTLNFEHVGVFMNSKTILFATLLIATPGRQNLGETLSSTSGQELINLGMVELGKGRYDKAVDALREAIRLSPDLSAAHRTLGEAYAAFGRNQDAVACFLEAGRLDPLDAQALMGLGNAYQALRRPREAIGAFKKATL